MRLQKLLAQFKPLAQELARDPEKVKQQALNLI
jgi:hypothetical protein